MQYNHGCAMSYEVLALSCNPDMDIPFGLASPIAYYDLAGCLRSCSFGYKCYVNDFQSSSSVGIVGMGLVDLFGESLGEERAGIHRAALQHRSPAVLVQLWRDRFVASTCRAVYSKDSQCIGVVEEVCFGCVPSECLSQTTRVCSAIVGADKLQRLTKSELRNAYFLTKFITSENISRITYRSVNTTDNHLQSVYSKLGLKSKYHVMKYLVDKGIHLFTESEWEIVVENACRGRRECKSAI